MPSKILSDGIVYYPLSKKQLVRGILRFLMIAVSQTFQETVKCSGIVRRHIDTD